MIIPKANFNHVNYISLYKKNETIVKITYNKAILVFLPEAVFTLYFHDIFF